jgi:hypothetical protein
MTRQNNLKAGKEKVFVEGLPWKGGFELKRRETPPRPPGLGARVIFGLWRL